MEAIVTVPRGGAVTIAMQPDDGSPIPGFRVAGTVVQISAPAASADAPLVLSFLVDSSILPQPVNPADLVLMRSEPPGALIVVADCAGAPAVAAPHPCIESRGFSGDDVLLVALTSHASQWAVLLPSHDLVLRQPRALQVKIPKAKTQVVKSFKAKVSNADILPSKDKAGHLARLLIDPGDCPSGIAGTPDFDESTAGSQDTIQLAGGQSRGARITLTINSAAFDSLNAMAPTCCALSLHAVWLVAGNTDPSPSNNTAAVEVIAFDLNDTAAMMQHESVMTSTRVVRLAVPKSGAPPNRSARVQLIKADVGNLGGHQIELGVEDGTCPPGLLGAVDLDVQTPGSQASRSLARGKTAQARISLNLDPATMTAENALSPARCIAVLNATTREPDNSEPLPQNNTTHVVIDVNDKTDY